MAGKEESVEVEELGEVEDVSGQIDVGEDVAEEKERGRFNPAMPLIVLGTIIVLASVSLAYLVFTNFRSQDTMTLVFIKDQQNLVYSIPWFGAIVKLLSTLVFILAGSKLIDKGVKLFGE